MSNSYASLSALVGAYLDGNLGGHQKDELERLVAVDENASRLLKTKTEERRSIKALIPDKAISKESFELLKRETREIADDLFPDKKASLLQRAAKILDTTILEF